MRLFNASSFALLTSFAFACSSLGGEDPNESNGSTMSPATGATVPATGGTNNLPVTPSTGSVPAPGGSAVTPSTTVTPVTSNTASSGTGTPTTGAPTPPPSNDEAEAPATGDGGTTPPVQSPDPDNSTPGNNPSPDTTSEPTPGPECTDTPPDDRQTCQTWAEWGECDAGWLKDPGFCAASCDRCDSGNMSVAPQPQPDPGGDATNDNDPDPDPDPMPDPGGSAGGGNPGGELGDDNPFGQVQGGQQGKTTRYWDCCKPHCAWDQGGGKRVDTCGEGGNNLGSSDERSACGDNPGGGFMCDKYGPWAMSNQVSFGYAAVQNNGNICGQCFQLQFTGTGGGNDSGSAALQGKTMIVMATNTGGDVAPGQFDLLIPGGGVGIFNACSRQWQADDLGEQYGGFLATCRQRSDDHATYKGCVMDYCRNTFANRPELMEGCEWFVNWFEAADNPDVVYQPVTCPSELQ